MNYVTSQSHPFEVFSAFFEGIAKNLHRSDEVQELISKSGYEMHAKQINQSKSADPKADLVILRNVTFRRTGTLHPDLILIQGTGGNTTVFIGLENGTPFSVSRDDSIIAPPVGIATDRIRDIAKMMYISAQIASKA